MPSDGQHAHAENRNSDVETSDGAAALSAMALLDASLQWLELHLDKIWPGWAEDAALHSEARQMSEWFTKTGQPVLTPSLHTPQTQAAYLAYFGPRAIAATSAVLAPFSPLAPTSAADLGAGTGCSSLPLRALGITTHRLLDHDSAALEVAGALIPGARSMATDLREAYPRITTQWVLSAFSLSELCRAGPDDEQEEEEERFDRLLDITDDCELLFIVDGGDRQRSRRMQRLRERALERELSVLAPCPHQDPCPALQRPRDWCHTRVPRHLTENFSLFAAGVGRDPNEMSLSYLVLSASHSQSRVVADSTSRSIRVIGSPRKEKGRCRVGICGSDGLRQIQVLKRHKQASRFCNGLQHGDLLNAPALEARRETLHIDDDNFLRFEQAERPLVP